MHGEANFVSQLAVVLCVAAVTAVLCQRLRQPLVLGYLLAGVVVGPHVPLPLVADPKTVSGLSELGVTLLLFSVGLEFSLRKLARVLPTAGVVLLVEVSLMFWLGYVVGQLFGWPPTERLFAGAVVAISSTMVVAKVFGERAPDPRVKELTFGVLILQDVVAIVMLASFTALNATGGLSGRALAWSVARLGTFLVGGLAIGMLAVPRIVRAIARLERPEVLLVASVGLCFAGALTAMKLGYSVALGSFLAGALVAESGHAAAVEHLVQPLRDLFAAIFFVSVGMTIDPRLLLDTWPAVLALTAVVLVGQPLSVSIGAFFTGHGARTAIQTGMSLAQVGEFSFVLVGLGVAQGSTRPFLFSVAVAVSVLTTFTTPHFVAAAPRVAEWVDGALPRPLQTFTTLYAAWIADLRRTRDARSRLVRIARVLLVDVACLVGVAVGARVGGPELRAFVEARFGLSASTSAWILDGAVVVSAAPLVWGMAVSGRALGASFAARILPRAVAGKTDLAAAPRRAIVVTMELAVVIVVGLVAVAVTQPLLPPLALGAVLLALVAALFLSFWRSTRDLAGHVRAGAAVVLEGLAAQSAAAKGDDDGGSTALRHAEELLPGIGHLVAVPLVAGAHAIGRSLAQLNLRGRTGATVLALQRAGVGRVPTAQEPLVEGDVLVLTGSDEAIARARALLTRGE
jgi:CPA2 family monovalent cation:H+ antiporter-2